MGIKFITKYKEFGGDGDSALDHVAPLNPADKEKVLKYIKSFKPDAIRCSLIKDYFSGEQTPLSIYVYSDGEYDWADDEIYHFEKYDIELNANFLKKILG